MLNFLCSDPPCARRDLIDEWIDAGTLDNTTEMVSFWESYAITYRYEGQEHPWIAFPVGELAGQEWHSWGGLSEDQVRI